MREFLKYLYTGKLQIRIGEMMAILRLASFFGMEQLYETCKLHFVEPGLMTVNDLCHLYCQVRDGS